MSFKTLIMLLRNQKKDVDNAGHAKVWTVVGADIVWIRSLVDTTG